MSKTRPVNIYQDLETMRNGRCRLEIVSLLIRGKRGAAVSFLGLIYTAAWRRKALSHTRHPAA